MSFEGLIQLIHREVARVLDRRARRTPCHVDGYDPDRFAVRLKLLPDDTLTGWVSIEPLQAGNGTGCYVAPNIGDPGWLEFHEDERGAAVFVGAAANDRFKPPSIKAGEVLLKPRSGSSVYLKDDGSVVVTDKAGSKVSLDGAGTATVEADTINLGPAGATLHKLLTDTAMSVFNSHSHPGNNQPPNALTRMNASDLTVNVNAV